MTTPTHSILIVDDDQKVCDLLSAFVKMAYPNILCVSANDTNQALMKLENQDFDLLIIDKVLPGKSGVDLIKQLKRSLRYANKQVILMSGNMERVDVYRMIHLGISDLIVKPFTFMQVKERIGKILNFETKN